MESERNNSVAGSEFEHIDVEEETNIVAMPSPVGKRNNSVAGSEFEHIDVDEETNIVAMPQPAGSEELKAEIGTLKVENKLLLAKVDSLQAQNGELRAKLEVAELKAKLANVEVEMPALVEAKMKELADKLEEKQSKLMAHQLIDDKGKKSELLLEKEKEMEEKKSLDKMCVNCHTHNTPLWRRNANNQLLCNDCGLYERLHGVNVSEANLIVDDKGNKVELMDMEKAKGMKVDTLEKQQKQKSLDKMCVNCHTQTTTSWRRNANNQLICNACGLYYRLHRTNRPMKLRQKSSTTNFHFTFENCWEKWNEDNVMVNDLLLVSKIMNVAGDFHHGNVIAKFAYANFYFEVLIKEYANTIYIGACDTAYYTASTFVGKFPNSCSIASLGAFYNEGDMLNGHFRNGFSINDTVGCGVMVLPGTELRVFFTTKNGNMHGTPVILPSSFSKELYPAVTLNCCYNVSVGSSIEANFGADLENKPFKYNIAEHKF